MLLLDKWLIGFGAHPWNPRGKYRLYKLLARSGRTLRGRTPAGITLAFRPDDVTCYYFFRDDYESQLSALIHALPRGGVFVDVGANVGNFSLLAARRVGASGLVAAFEPNPETYARLLDHIAINHANGLVSFHAAVGAAPGSVDLVCTENSGLSHLGSGRVNERAARRVAQTTLDDSLPPLLRGRSIDLMKIDVEGAELGVLQGAEQLLLAGRIERLHVEICAELLGRFETTPEQIWRFMEERGYTARHRNAHAAIYDEIFERS
jgi:FkbM family methyltransferase